MRCDFLLLKIIEKNAQEHVTEKQTKKKTIILELKLQILLKKVCRYCLEV